MTFNSIQFQCKLGILLFVCFFTLGCSDKVAVKGTVTYADNGEVVKNGEVIFRGEKELGRAVIKNGKYSVGLARDGEGLRPGTYIVTSEVRTPPIPPEAIPPGKTVFDLLDIYYLDEPITVEVKGRTVCDFTVERGERPSTPKTN